MSTICSDTELQPNRAGGLVHHVDTCELDGPDHKLLHDLDRDFVEALECTKPLLGIFRRRGQIRFAVIKQGSPVVKELKQRGYHISAVKPSDCQQELVNLHQAIERAKRVRRVRVNGLEMHQLPGGEVYFTYHVDLEAA